MKLVIGLSGLKGSGKTTAAEYMVAHHGFMRMSFAGPIKHMLRVLGVLEDWPKEEPHPLLCGMTPRHALQTLGTQWGRDMIGGNIWVNIVKDRIEKSKALNLIVIDDVRFRNEVAMIEELNKLPRHRGIVTYISRDETPNVRDWHQSEMEVLELSTHATIQNNTSVEGLCKSLDQMLYTI